MTFKMIGSTSFCLSCILALVSGAAASNTLVGDRQLPANDGSAERATDLFRGDLGAEIGIGCSQGPNDAAVCIAVSAALPFNLTSHYYNIFTAAPRANLTFKVWSAGDVPGVTQSVVTGLDPTLGDHTVTFSPPISITSARFYFGQSLEFFLRWGLDTSSGSPVQSFIRAEACDVPEWVSLDAIGFPGNWVMSVSVGSGVPIELQEDTCEAPPTPTIDSSWGTTKSRDWSGATK